jgi:hypothetical protein
MLFEKKSKNYHIKDRKVSLQLGKDLKTQREPLT